MARRVSLKGKGADLFFGDHPPGVDNAIPDGDDHQADLPVATDPELDVSRSDDAAVSEEDTGVTATAARTDSTPDGCAGSIEETDVVGTGLDKASISAPSSVLPPVEDGLFDMMWERLASQASISNSFRYTAPELEEMADALYQVSKAARARLTKQDIARLGLNVVLWDYRRRGDASWLSEFARRKRRPQES